MTYKTRDLLVMQKPGMDCLSNLAALGNAAYDKGRAKHRVACGKDARNRGHAVLSQRDGAAGSELHL